MEATIFTSWIYDYLLPHAAAVKVAHPLMLRAIAAAKKKNDRIDAARIADEAYMAPAAIRQRRRTLRYRKLLIRQNVQTEKQGRADADGVWRELQQAEVASAGLLPSGVADEPLD